jgi:hypothetical protein
MQKRAKTQSERLEELRGSVGIIKKALGELEKDGDINSLRMVASQLRSLVVYESNSRTFNHPLLIELAREANYPLTVYTSDPNYCKKISSMTPDLYVGGDSISLQKDEMFQFETNLENALEETYVLTQGETITLKKLIRMIADTEASHYDPDRPVMLDKLSGIVLGGLSSEYRAIYHLGRIVVDLGQKLLDVMP